MNTRGRRAQTGNAATSPTGDSLDDLLSSLDPRPRPSVAAPITSTTILEIEDLIAGLDDVVVEPPDSRRSKTRVPIPPKASVRSSTIPSELDDLLKELETGKPARPPPATASAQPPRAAASTVVPPICASSGAIQKDIQNLSSTSEGHQELALRNVINFCLEEPNRVIVRQHGGIVPVLRLLKSPNPDIQALAAHALANLALHGENRAAVRHAGGSMGSLVRVLAATSHDEVREKVLSSISNLCVDEPTNRQEFVRAGLIKTVVAVLKSSSNDDVVKRALSVIVNTSSDRLVQQELMTSGGIQVIVPLVHSSNLEKQTNAAWALAALTMGGPDVQKALFDAGALTAFVKLLESGNPNAELKAITALVNLSGNDLLQRPIKDARAIPAVLAHVSSPNSACIRYALQTLQNLALSGECRLSIQAAGGVAKVMEVLRSLSTKNREHLDTLPHALRVVINLTGETKIRRAFVDGGAIHLVERLASDQDPTVSQCAKQALNNLKIPS